jgi:hypothetical protein
MVNFEKINQIALDHIEGNPVRRKDKQELVLKAAHDYHVAWIRFQNVDDRDLKVVSQVFTTLQKAQNALLTAARMEIKDDENKEA